MKTLKVKCECNASQCKECKYSINEVIMGCREHYLRGQSQSEKFAIDKNK
jgi:hypothetical protein